jgi:hypothetical protein
VLKLYLLVAADYENQNAKVMPFIEKKVKATGTLREKGGMAGLTIKTIGAARQTAKNRAGEATAGPDRRHLSTRRSKMERDTCGNRPGRHVLRTPHSA